MSTATVHPATTGPARPVVPPRRDLGALSLLTTRPTVLSERFVRGA